MDPHICPMAAVPGEPDKGQAFTLLGILDAENTPCAWDSILYGSLGSAVAGLERFLLTSRSYDIGLGFILVTLGCWFHFKYSYTKRSAGESYQRRN